MAKIIGGCWDRWRRLAIGCGCGRGGGRGGIVERGGRYMQRKMIGLRYESRSYIIYDLIRIDMEYSLS